MNEPISVPKDEITRLVGRLKDLEGGCEDKCLDLQTLKFGVQNGEVRLYNEHHAYYFKHDPENPKDAKIIYAIKQFCKIMGVPYSFFAKNPEYMKTYMVECWLPSVKQTKSVVLAKLRTSKDKGDIIRAILPAEYTNISNHDVMGSVAGVIGSDFNVDFIIGEDRDEPVLHVRFISKEEFEAFGDQYAVGFSVVVSELGACPLSIETLLFKVSSKAAFLASYGNESFFSCNYEKIQPNDLKELFPKLISRLRGQLPDIKLILQASKEVSQDQCVNDILKELHFRKGLSDKFHVLLFQEIQKDPTVKNKLDVANKMSILAKDVDVIKRVKIERIAGDLIGLSFAKS